MTESARFPTTSLPTFEERAWKLRFVASSPATTPPAKPSSRRTGHRRECSGSAVKSVRYSTKCGTPGRPKLQGVILPGGGDWQRIGPNGLTSVEARYFLKASGGTIIEVTNPGVRVGSPEVIERLARGERVDPAAYYFRTTPSFRGGRGSALLAPAIGVRRARRSASRPRPDRLLSRAIGKTGICACNFATLSELTRPPDPSRRRPTPHPAIDARHDPAHLRASTAWGG